MITGHKNAPCFLAGKYGVIFQAVLMLQLLHLCSGICVHMSRQQTFGSAFCGFESNYVTSGISTKNTYWTLQQAEIMRERLDDDIVRIHCD